MEKTFEDGMKEVAAIIKDAITKHIADVDTIYRICEDILGIEHENERHDDLGFNPWQE